MDAMGNYVTIIINASWPSDMLAYFGRGYKMKYGVSSLADGYER